MSNTTVVFFPTERAIPAAPDPETPYQIDFTATAVSRSDDLSKAETKTKSGIVLSSKYYDKRVYTFTTAPAGRANEPSIAEMEMFAASVANSETFTVTLLDEADRVATVQCIGRVQQQDRASSVDVGVFPYTFTAREV